MSIGGTEQVIRQIVENSNHRLFQHEILCIDGKVGSLGKGLADNSITIETLYRKPGFDFKLIRNIRNLIKSKGYDVIHCHQYTPYFYGVLAALRTGVKVVFTEHGRFYPDRHNYKRRFINPVLARLTDNITAISGSTANALATYEYIARNRIQVIYNGIKRVDTSASKREGLLRELQLSQEFRYVGTISRLEPIKNQSMMINAFNKVRKSDPRLKLVIIGDGAKMVNLKDLVTSLELEGDVIFTGFVENPQKYLSAFELFLLSSFSEGTSMTLLEAMSVGTPSVVTNVGGNPEIVIDHQTGLIVESDDTDAFAKAMNTLLVDNTKRLEMGKKCKSRFQEHFLVSRMVDQYEAIYAS